MVHIVAKTSLPAFNHTRVPIRLVDTHHRRERSGPQSRTRTWSVRFRSSAPSAPFSLSEQALNLALLRDDCKTTKRRPLSRGMACEREADTSSHFFTRKGLWTSKCTSEGYYSVDGLFHATMSTTLVPTERCRFKAKCQPWQSNTAEPLNQKFHSAV